MPVCRQGHREDRADGEDLTAKFEGTQLIWFKVDKDGDCVKVIGGEIGGDDSGLVISESGVTKRHGDEIVGYAFDAETRITHERLSGKTGLTGFRQIVPFTNREM